MFCIASDFEICKRRGPNADSQFQLIKLKLGDISPRRFYRSSLFPSQLVYCIYRGFLAAYFLAWFVTQIIIKELSGESPKHFIFLTTWAETTLNCHLIASFFTCVYGYLYEYEDESSASSPSSSSMNVGSHSKAKLIPNGLKQSSERSDSSSYREANFELRWFHKLSWILYIFGIDIAFSVSLAFWAILRTEFDAFSWHCHAINSIAICLDLFVSDVPVRLFHFVWTWPWGLTYISFTYFIYKADIYVVVYDQVLAWGDVPATTCIVVFGVCFVLVPSCHAFAFGVHTAKLRFVKSQLFRQYLYSHKSASSSNSDIFQDDGWATNMTAFEKSMLNKQPVSTMSPNMITKSPRKNKVIQIVNESEKRTRRRTCSGNYSRLQETEDYEPSTCYNNMENVFSDKETDM